MEIDLNFLSLNPISMKKREDRDRWFAMYTLKFRQDNPEFCAFLDIQNRETRIHGVCWDQRRGVREQGPFCERSHRHPEQPTDEDLAIHKEGCKREPSNS